MRVQQYAIARGERSVALRNAVAKTIQTAVDKEITGRAVAGNSLRSLHISELAIRYRQDEGRHADGRVDECGGGTGARESIGLAHFCTFPITYDKGENG